VSYGNDLQAEVRALIDEANSLRVTAVRELRALQLAAMSQPLLIFLPLV
jgi:hypothetical protein